LVDLKINQSVFVMGYLLWVDWLKRRKLDFAAIQKEQVTPN